MIEVPIGRYSENIAVVKEKLDREDLLLQLNEEAGEVVCATAKLCRILRGKNPTPKTENEVLQNLIEELSDVKTAMDALGLRYDADVMAAKANRWAHRLTEGLDDGGQ